MPFDVAGRPNRRLENEIATNAAATGFPFLNNSADLVISRPPPTAKLASGGENTAGERKSPPRHSCQITSAPALPRFHTLVSVVARLPPRKIGLPNDAHRLPACAPRDFRPAACGTVGSNCDDHLGQAIARLVPQAPANC